MPSNYQVIVRVIPGGGCKTKDALIDQWNYLTKKRPVLENVGGEFVEVRREHPKMLGSERHQKAELARSEISNEAGRWIEESGLDLGHNNNPRRDQDLTTHIVVSFPKEFDRQMTEDAGRAWAEEMFGMQQKHGGEYNYFTFLHLNKPHPHVHIVVNRQPTTGRRLKISGSRDGIKWETLRKVMAEISYDFNFPLDASSREERNITERPITYAEYRRRMRHVEVEPDVVEATPPPSPVGGAIRDGASQRSSVGSPAPSLPDVVPMDLDAGPAGGGSPEPRTPSPGRATPEPSPSPGPANVPQAEDQLVDREELERRRRRRRRLVEQNMRRHAMETRALTEERKLRLRSGKAYERPAKARRRTRRDRHER